MRSAFLHVPAKVLWSGLLIPAVMACGGKTRDEPDVCEKERWRCYDYDDGWLDDYQEPNGPGQQSNTGGSAPLDEQEGGMAGSPLVSEPVPPSTSGSFQVQGEGMMVNPVLGTPLGDYYPATPLPKDTFVEASLDGVEIRTVIAGSVLFVLDACTAGEGVTEVCRLTITAFSGSPATMEGVDGPYDGRLTYYSGRDYVTSTVRSGGSWSAHLEPTDAHMMVQRWEGAVIDEYYQDGELFRMVVEQEKLYEYLLPIVSIHASCTTSACAFSLVAGSK